MHYLRHVKLTSEFTLFSFPVFIIWKLNTEGKKKDKTVVDIQKLYKMIFFDSDFLPLQSEIIANVQRYTNLAIMNATFFFYQ